MSLSSKTVLLAVAATAWPTCSFAQSFGPSIRSEVAAPSKGASSATRDAGEDELARRLYKAELKRAFTKDPYLYESVSRVMSSPSQATVALETMALNKRKREEAEIRNGDSLNLEIGAPLNITGINIKASHDFLDKEKARYELDQRRAQERNVLLTDMASDRGNRKFNDTTSYLSDLAYRASRGEALSQSDKILIDFYNTNVKPESKDFPVAAGNLKSMVDTTNDLSEILAKVGYTAPQVRDVMTGKKTLDQIDNPAAQQNLEIHIQQTVQQTLAQAATTVIFEQQEKNPNLEQIRAKLAEVAAAKTGKNSSLTLDDREKLNLYEETLRTAEKKVRLENHEAAVKEMRDYGSAVTNVAALFSESPNIQAAATTYNAGLDVYNAVGGMLINGALDPSGISAIAGGVGAIINVFGPKGPSATLGMLKEILRLQREIIKKLDVIDQKVDVLNDKLDQILDRLGDIDEAIRRGFDDLKETDTEHYWKLKEQARDNTQILLQQPLMNEAELNLETIVDPHKAPKERDCLALPARCAGRQSPLFDSIQASARRLKFAALHDLAKRPFIPEDTILQQNETDLRIQMRPPHPVEDRVGQLKDTVAFINSQIPAGSSLQPIRDGAFSELPHPFFLTSKYVPLYSDLVTHLPAASLNLGTLGDIKELSGSIQRVALASEEMRSQADLARKIFVHASSLLAVSVQDELYRAAKRDGMPADKITKPFLPGVSIDPEAKIVDIDASADMKEFPASKRPVMPGGLLFGGYDRGKIRDTLGSLSNVEFENLGKSFGLFKSEDSQPSVSPEPKADCQDVRVPGPGGAGSRLLYIQCHTDGYQTRTTEYFIALDLKAAQDVLGNSHAELPKYLVSRHIETYHLRKSGGHVDEYSLAKKEDVHPDRVAKTRTPYEEVLASFIVKKQADIARDFRDDVSSVAVSGNDVSGLRANMVRARLALDTFLKGGFGECLAVEPELKDARAIHLSAAKIDAYYDAMRMAADIPELLALQNKALDEITELSSLHVPDVKSTAVGCALGWGDTQAAMTALERADAYVRSQLHAPHPGN